jgi:lipoate-protein ligase B
VSPARADVAASAAGARIPWRVLDLGLAPYGAVLEQQLALLKDRIQDRVPDTLILVEHPPVVTLGRAKTTANLRHTPEELRARGVEFFEVSRGGDVTYHAPGQLVGYPVFDLLQHGRDVLRFCRGVEAALIGVLEAVGLGARSVPGKAGVWVGDRKIASLGVSLRRWVTFHGFALNVTVDLLGFQVIRPCGEEPEIMTSMEALLKRPVPMDDVRRLVVGEFARRFGFGEQCAVSR